MRCQQLGGACDLGLQGMGWYRDTERAFAALPDD